MTNLGIRGCENLVEVGRGGFAVVYRAWQPAFERNVAIKVLTTDLDEPVVQRFERECAAIGGMSGHPHIVTVYDVGRTADDMPYIVMEYLDDGSLGHRLERRGRLRWSHAVEIGIKVAGALESAHRRDVLHRDVKPDNVMISRYGEPKLGDFGIARMMGRDETRPGVVMATPAHAPPEVLDGARPTAAADVYSLASSVHALITGAPPFVRADDESLAPVYARIATAPPPDLRPLGVPEAVCDALERAMAKDPVERQQTAADFARELQRAQSRAGVRVTDLTIDDRVHSGASERSVTPGGGSETHATRPPAADTAVGARPPAQEPKVTDLGSATRSVPRLEPAAATPSPAPAPAPAPSNAAGNAAATIHSAVPDRPAVSPSSASPPPPDRAGRDSPRRIRLLAAVGILLVTVIGAGWLVARSGGTSEDAAAPTASVTVATAPLNPEVIVEDDFTEAKPGWEQSDNAAQTLENIDGGYHVTTKVADSWLLSIFDTAEPTRDVIVAASGSPLSGAGAFGVVCHYADEEGASFDIALIDGRGTWSILTKPASGSFQTLAEGKAAIPPASAGVPHRVELECIGSVLRLVADGQLIGVATSPNPRTGLFGVGVIAVGGPYKVSFDDFVARRA